MIDRIDGVVLEELSITNLHQLEEAEETKHQNLHWEEIEIGMMDKHQTMMFVALIAKPEEISLDQSIKFCRIVLIFVNSLIDAHQRIDKVKLFGKL